MDLFSDLKLFSTCRKVSAENPSKTFNFPVLAGKFWPKKAFKTCTLLAGKFWPFLAFETFLAHVWQCAPPFLLNFRGNEIIQAVSMRRFE